MKPVCFMAVVVGLAVAGCYTPDSDRERRGPEAVPHEPGGIESRSRESFGSFSNPASVSDPRAVNSEIIDPGKAKSTE